MFDIFDTEYPEASRNKVKQGQNNIDLWTTPNFLKTTDAAKGNIIYRATCPILKNLKYH